MKNMFMRVALLTLVMMTSCATLTQMASLMTCQYNLQGVTSPKLAGISLTNTSDLTRLDAATLLKVTTSLLSGSLPLSATVNLGVTNPNATPAQLAGLDWALFMDNTSMLTGQTDKAVSVAANGGKTTIPFTVQMDLAQLFKGQSKEAMLNFANGLMHVGESNSKVSLKIRPAVSFGGQVYKTGYINVSKTL